MENNFTFITGYTNLQNHETRKNTKTVDDYLKHSIPIFKSGMPIVFYCQKDFYYIFDEIMKECPNVISKTFVVEDFRHNNSRFFKTKLPDNLNKDKDTHWYLGTILQKVYWMEEVANDNPYNSKYFCWVDIGINHVIHEPSTILRKYLLNINSTDIKDRIILPSNGKLEDLDTKINYYNNNFNECLMGGIIAGSKEKIIWFSKKQYEAVNNLIKNDNKITWEINYWLLIVRDNQTNLQL